MLRPGVVRTVVNNRMSKTSNNWVHSPSPIINKYFLGRFTSWLEQLQTRWEQQDPSCLSPSAADLATDVTTPAGGSEAVSTTDHGERKTGSYEAGRETDKGPVHDGDEATHTAGMVVDPGDALTPSASPPSDGFVGRDGGGVGGAGEVGEREVASRVSEQYLLEAAGSMIGEVGGGDVEGDEVGGISIDPAVLYVCPRSISGMCCT